MCEAQDGATHSVGSSTGGNGNEPPQNPPTIDQRRARLDEIDEARRRLDDERAQLHLELAGSKDPTPARAHARDVHQRIVDDIRDDDHGTPVFKRASQNLAAAAVLLRGCPEPTTPEDKKMRQQLRTLLEAAAVQQAECSASR